MLCIFQPRQGQIQDFPKGGVETRDTKCVCVWGGGGAVCFRPDTKRGGGGVLPSSGLIQKAGGGGAVCFRPDTKSGGGEGGGGCCPFKA